MVIRAVKFAEKVEINGTNRVVALMSNSDFRSMRDMI